MSKRFYTRKDLADLLGVTTRTIHTMDQRREIPGRTSINQRVIRYFAPAVDDWLKRKGESVR